MKRSDSKILDTRTQGASPQNPTIACSLISQSALAAAAPGTAKSNSSTWTNNWSYPIFVTDGYVWVGVSKDNFGDVSWILADPRYVYTANNDDHYANRSGIPMNKDPFAAARGAYYVVNPGDSVTCSLTANCDVQGSIACVAQLFFQLNYVA